MKTSYKLEHQNISCTLSVVESKHSWLLQKKFPQYNKSDEKDNERMCFTYTIVAALDYIKKYGICEESKHQFKRERRM